MNKIRLWLLKKLNGVPRENYCDAIKAWTDVISRYEVESREQMARIEAFILRETFGDRAFLRRREALREHVATAIHEVFDNYFKELALYQGPTHGGKTPLQSAKDGELL